MDPRHLETPFSNTTEREFTGGRRKKSIQRAGTGKTVTTKAPVKRNPRAIGSGEVNDILFEIIKVKSSGDEVSVFIDVTNMTDDSSVTLPCTMKYTVGGNQNWRSLRKKEYNVSQVVFWKGNQKTSMYDAGNRGVSIDPKTTQTAQLIFKKVPTNLENHQ